jgi:redox-sensitive bicupin YhaK (pirin superfamily)
MTRHITHITSGVPASDGAGVKLTRILGSPQLDMVDPLLMLDRFESDNPEDYIAGFPPHPHRGFETVTYMLAGKMRHKDSVGNAGVIGPGGVQWMRAGRGIIHSEMPEQEAGLMRGFQLWINLPASHKLCAPDYQEFTAADIPSEATEAGGEIRVIAGITDAGTRGAVSNAETAPIYLDVSLTAGERFAQAIPESHNAVVQMVEGDIIDDRSTALSARQFGVLSTNGRVSLSAGDTGARFLLIGGRALKEPIARGGPFVMNTRAEVLQAFEDYKSGNFARG